MPLPPPSVKKDTEKGGKDDAAAKKKAATADVKDENAKKGICLRIGVPQYASAADSVVGGGGDGGGLGTGIVMLLFVVLIFIPIALFYFVCVKQRGSKEAVSELREYDRMSA
jgi:hypothetical protein